MMTDYFRCNGPFRGYKGTFYEGGIRVPLIVHWPGRTTSGATSDHVCAFQDVLPTVCDIAGIKIPQPTDGISLVPTLTNEGVQQEHHGLYWEYQHEHGSGWAAARVGPWKAVQHVQDGPVELYDLPQDLAESTDIGAQHPAVLQEMTAFMRDSHTAPRDYQPATIAQPKVATFVR
jgi:arylsulfatase A-like enzyme